MPTDKRNICYRSILVRREFEDMPLLEAERRLLKKRLGSMPDGFKGTFLYPQNGTKIGGHVYIFSLESDFHSVTIVKISKKVNLTKMMLGLYKLRYLWKWFASFFVFNGPA